MATLKDLKDELTTLAEESEWPAFFGADCPPSMAHDLEGTLFRLVKSDPPTAQDFKSAYELGVFAGQDHHIRAGLSCSKTIEHLAAVKKLVPTRRQDKVASAELDAVHGKCLQTGKAGHWTAWLRSAALSAAPTLFGVVQP